MSIFHIEANLLHPITSLPMSENSFKSLIFKNARESLIIVLGVVFVLWIVVKSFSNVGLEHLDAWMEEKDDNDSKVFAMIEAVDDECDEKIANINVVLSGLVTEVRNNTKVADRMMDFLDKYNWKVE